MLVPERAPERALLQRAVESYGAVWVGPARAEECDVALVDLTAPDGPSALAALRQSSAGERLSVVAVALPGRATGELRLADFVAPSGVEDELPARLARVQARHAQVKEERQRQKDLGLLLKLTADYAESTDVAELLHDVTKRLAAEMDIERASLVVLDEAQGAGFVLAASDDAALKDHRIELSRYPEIREVLRTGKPVIVEDAPSHPLLEGVKSEVAAKGFQNIAVLPLAVRGKVEGVLFLRASARRGAFSGREIDFLATVAHATAVALRNARQLESIRGKIEREKNARIAAEERAAG